MGSPMELTAEFEIPATLRGLEQAILKVQEIARRPLDEIYVNVRVEAPERYGGSKYFLKCRWENT